MSTLRDLIFKRPSRQFQYLHVLLDLSSHEKDKVTPLTRCPSLLHEEGLFSRSPPLWLSPSWAPALIKACPPLGAPAADIAYEGQLELGD